MFPICFMIAAVALLFNIVESSTADAAKVFRCPCTFSVVRNVDRTGSTNNEAFDVLVENFDHPRSELQGKRGKIIDKHSSRNVKISNAIHFDSMFIYFRQIDIKDTGLFRVYILHHGNNAAHVNPDYNLQLHQSAKQVICPVLLEPDLPSTRLVKTKAKNAEALNASTRQHRIEGGLVAAPGLVPYIVSIAIPCPNGKPDCLISCSGTLVSARWVLTAAHCNVPVGSKVHVSSRVRLKGFSVRVKTWIPHPLFNLTMGSQRQNQFDIAVLELDRKVRNCCFVSPRFMAISLDQAFPRAGVFTRAAGFGMISDNRGARREVSDGALRTVDLPIVKHRFCRQQYGDHTLDSISARRQLCAGYFEDGGCDTCFGDSGGPLVRYDGNRPVLIGITSFGVGCGRPNFPGVYTRPSGHKEWLKSTGAVFKKHTGRIDEVIVKCAPGEFLPYEPGKISTCTACPTTRFSIGGTLRECRRCPTTLWRDSEDGSRCSCRARKGFALLGRRCVQCRPGSASDFGSNICVQCRSGTFSNSFGRSTCKSCPGARRGARRCASK